MSTARNYTSGTEKALFLLSRGLCYAPHCAERVIRRVDGDDVVNVQIAHVRAAKPNGLRYDPRMTDDERRHFSNLLLLCTVHHKRVDSKVTGQQYTVETLHSWKTAREDGFTGYLEGLDGLTQDSLEHLIVSAVSGVRDKMDEAIGRLEALNKDAAGLLRELMSETYDRPYLDLDAVASLEHSANMLMNLPDEASSLRGAVNQLENIELHAARLESAMQAAAKIEQYTAMITEAQTELYATTFNLGQASATASQAAYQVHADIAEEITLLTAAASQARQANTAGLMVVEPATRHEKWNYFKYGFATAVAIGAAITILVLVLINAKSSGDSKGASATTRTITVFTDASSSAGAGLHAATS